jgi:hypothetical protein
MSGRADLGFAEQDEIAALWRSHGWVVVVPAELDVAMGYGPPEYGYPWDVALRIDEVVLETVDAIVLAPSWEKSKGCKRELAKALELGLQVLFADHPVKAA